MTVSGAARSMRAALVEVPVDMPSIQFRKLSDIIAERREPSWLLPKVLERNVIAVLAGSRGTFKSFIALEWAMRIAMNDDPVLILSGEGAGLGMRAEAWLKAHSPTLDAADLAVIALERQLALTVPAELELLTAEIATLASPPVLIVIDTWSKFAGGLDENSNSEVAEYLSSLSRALRERFRCTVLIVAHTGHTESGRPRGASALTANTDCELIVSRQPLAMNVSISRERFKDTPSLPPLGYDAKVIDLGRLDAYGEPVTSLVLFSTDAPPSSPRAGGKNQQLAITALREWCRAHPEALGVTSIEIGDMLKAQGISSKRKPEALNWLVNAGVISPIPGGYSVARDQL
jgi:hypothetical protein